MKRRSLPRPVREYDLFPSGESYILYLKMLDWCVEDSARSPYPLIVWSIPVAVVNDWNMGRAAKTLIDDKKIRKDAFRKTYKLLYETPGCSPDAIIAGRKYRRDQKAAQRQKAPKALPDSPLESRVSHGDTGPCLTETCLTETATGRTDQTTSDQGLSRSVSRRQNASL
jgi:hypothetical protein